MSTKRTAHQITRGRKVVAAKAVRSMSADDITMAMNEWMRRYIESPDEFQRDFRTVTEFLADNTLGREPSYGESCAAYLFKLLDEMNGAAIAA